MKIEVRRILVTLVVLVVMSPTMAIAAAWYRCTMDGEVRSACCCPEDKSEEATDIPSDAPPVLRATCCEVETLSAAASQPRLKADLTLAALGAMVVPRTVTDVETPPFALPIRSASRAARPPSRAPPLFLSHCSLLL